MMQYKSISIPKPLVDRIDKIHILLGYRSRAEFVCAAIRPFIVRKELEALEIEEIKKEAAENK